jgi:polysaccharide deacetylase 2 family uncharacterized protein YibQ
VLAAAGSSAAEPPAPALSPALARPQIAVIIDDLGYRRAEGLRAAALPGPVAVAVLPHTAHGPALAAEADRRGKEVVLHVPMQAVALDGHPGPGALELGHSRSELAAVLAGNLAAVPLARGVSNHMGSLLTVQPRHMRWIMEELRAREAPLFFVDSATTPASVALRIAREEGIPALRRDVFLDTDLTPDAIAFQWRRLVALARSRGFAVAIGHPHAATLELLERVLPRLPEEGIELVPLGALLSRGSEP